MPRSGWPIVLALLALTGGAWAQSGRGGPHVGYVYPAGGQQGTTFQVRLGGQRLDFVDGATVSGSGVSAKVVDYFRKMSNQEMNL